MNILNSMSNNAVLKNNFIIRTFLLLVCLLCLFKQHYGQADFQPKQYQNHKVTDKALDVLKANDPDLDLPNTSLDRSALEEFRQFVLAEQKSPFKNGEIFFNDVFTQYARQVLKEILRNNNVAHDYQIFITKDPTPNAKALPGGIILLNVGLISQMENEAQLAYIICHEMAHIKKHHLFQIYEKTMMAKEKELNTTFSDRGYRQLQYSREFESEADAVGLQLYGNTDYKLDEATKTLGRLKDSNTYHFKPVNIAESLPIDSAKISKDSSLIAEIKEEQEKLVLREEAFGDQFTSHPDLEKRMKALKEIISEMTKTGPDQLFKVGSQKGYEAMSRSATFESVESYYSYSKYGPSLFLALQLLKTYPENQYLQGAIVKNLYWLSHFKELKNLKEVVTHQGWQQSDPYLNFYAKLSNIGLKTFKEMAYDYGDQLAPQNEVIQFYTALAARNYLGKSLGKNKLNAFQQQYPNSQFQNYVQYQLD